MRVINIAMVTLCFCIACTEQDNYLHNYLSGNTWSCELETMYSFDLRATTSYSSKGGFWGYATAESMLPKALVRISVKGTWSTSGMVLTEKIIEHKVTASSNVPKAVLADIENHFTKDMRSNKGIFHQKIHVVNNDTYKSINLPDNQPDIICNKVN